MRLTLARSLTIVRCLANVRNVMTRDSTPLDIHHAQGYAVAIMLAVVLLAGVNWILSPEQALRWFRAMLALPLTWCALTLWYHWLRRSRPASNADDAMAVKRYFLSVMTLVVFTLGIWQITVFGLEIWVRLGDHRVDLGLELRILGLAISAVFVIIGNTMPKILTPLAMLPLHLAERVTSARRFAGTTFVLLGLVLAIGFLVLPIEGARAFVPWAFVGGLLTILGAIIWMNAGPRRLEE